MVDFIKCIASHPTGSRYICDPPPTDTDNDTVILIAPEDFDSVNVTLMLNDWELGGSMVPGDIWYSYKKGIENYIITTSEEHYRKWITATRIAKKFNMVNKEDRIDLFKAIVDSQYDSVKTYYAGQL